MIKTFTCHTVHCDGCEKPLEAEYVIHFKDPDEAIDQLKDDDYTVLRDGRIFCPAKECWEKMPPCVCPDADECGDDCKPGCPCVRHEQIEPDGPCEECGYTCERDAGMRWHRYTSHGKTTVIRTTLARSAPSTSEVTP